MAYQLNIDQHRDYLSFEVTGENSPESVRGYLEQIARECEKRDCFRMLVHEKLTGPRLPTMDVFEIISEGAMKVLGRFEAIAYVDETMGDMGEFAEAVAINRGMPLAFFTNVADAENWIRSRKAGTDEQYIFWKGDTDAD